LLTNVWQAAVNVTTPLENNKMASCTVCCWD